MNLDIRQETKIEVSFQGHKREVNQIPFSSFSDAPNNHLMPPPTKKMFYSYLEQRREEEEEEGDLDFDAYMAEAKKMKHEADRETDRERQAMRYLQAVLYFSLCGNYNEQHGDY